MSEPEHIKFILKRVFKQLEEDWKQRREKKEIETIRQESTVEADKI
ncbi:MAG: hypothetical protein GTN76_16400 [Candidatus Aenigmarchaeota archaeon]|nr:hypothetical protein [Candidatus Aenigmarchaeota archaeon]